MDDAGVTAATVTHPEAALFGQSHIRPVRMDAGLDANVGHDTLAELHTGIASAVVEWLTTTFEPRA